MPKMPTPKPSRRTPERAADYYKGFAEGTKNAKTGKLGKFGKSDFNAGKVDGRASQLKQQKKTAKKK